MAYRYRLSSLLNLVVLICFLLWIYQLDGGDQIVKGLGFWIHAGLGFCVLIWIGSYLLGTPGYRQRDRAMTLCPN